MPTPRRETLDEKAQRLIDAQQVRIVFDNGLVVQGHVIGDHDEYDTLVYPSGLFFCTCKWGQYHNITRYPCSHAIALRLYKANQPVASTLNERTQP